LEGKGEFAVPTLEGKREPGVSTPEAIRGAHGKESDAISVTVGIKLRRGAAVADLIKVFETTPQTFDPGVRSNLAEVRKMSPAVDGGDQGGAGEAPTHPKSIGGSAIVPMRPGCKLMFVEEQVEEDINWDGEAMEGSNVGPEAHIGGDIDSEDEARVEFEDEEEGVQAEPEGWQMFARYYSPKAMNINVIQPHFMDVWRIRGTMTFSPLKMCEKRNRGTPSSNYDATL
jgi:hypothetical protein